VHVFSRREREREREKMESEGARNGVVELVTCFDRSNGTAYETAFGIAFM
jgi:hypothetical protein